MLLWNVCAVLLGFLVGALLDEVLQCRRRRKFRRGLPRTPATPLRRRTDRIK